MSDQIITAQRASSVYKALPGLWHTISTTPRTNIEGKQSRESVTSIVTKTIQSKDWKIIEEAENHHWFQVRDPESLRIWIQKNYEHYFNNVIPTDNFLITDIHRANIQIYPRTFRCPKCNSLVYIASDKNIGEEVSQNSPPPAKTGIACPVCGCRPITQQPHVLLDYDTGFESQLPTKCLNGHPLKLKFSGSVVSILGWRLSCNDPSCIYGKDRDPFAKKNDMTPYFPLFFNNGKRMAITPTTRGPRQPIVITKVDTMRFPFKPDEALLASIFQVSNSPTILELFYEWCKIRKAIMNDLKKYIRDTKARIKDAEERRPGDELFDDIVTKLFKNDPSFKEISERADDAGNKLKQELIRAGIPLALLESFLHELRFEFDEIVNLSISEGFSYEEFINKLNERDPRKLTLKLLKENLIKIHISSIRYLYHDESIDLEEEPNRSLQIVKVGIGTKVSEQNVPFYAIRSASFEPVMDKNNNRIKPDQNHPIVYGTNHPIEAIFIQFDPTIIVDKLKVEKKSENDSINLAIIEKDEKKKEIEKLLHTLSHIFIRRISYISGLGLGSISHRIFPKAGAILLYTTVHPTLGQLREAFEHKMIELTDPVVLKRQASNCPRDPICSENEIDPANCFACLHIPDHCCDGYWNRELDRRVIWNINGTGLWN